MSNQLAEIETPSVPAEIEEPVSESTAIIQVIERAALNPAIDVEKMERLLSLQERILDREAEQSFNVAMKAAQEEMPQVLRDAKNASTSSRYARLETIAKAINPVVTKHGFSMSFGTDDSPLENHYRVTCKVSHVDGHSRDYHADVPADLTGMKGNQNKT
ncbi:MAG: ERF family protein, partial [Geminicoccaceae bacterium]